MSLRDQMRKGSTEILILSLLAGQPMYGYQINQEMAQRSKGYFEMKEGLLYPTLHRMEKEGLLSSHWQAAGEARRRKYYVLTEKGRKMLREQTAEWQNFIDVMQAMIS
jgi:PadR family transcriptional regulator PadR